MSINDQEKLDIERVRHLAALLQLDLDEDELPHVALQLQRMAELAEQLEINLDDKVGSAMAFKAR